MDKKTGQWLEQSDYDMDTAEYMLKGGRYFYALFMCHLSIEKALKGLFWEKLKEVPPKTHNLITLLNKLNTKPPEEEGKFIVRINTASVLTRYPEDLKKSRSNIPKTLLLICLNRVKG